MDPKAEARPRERDVEAPRVVDEAEHAALVRAHGADDDDVLLVPLEAVDGSDMQVVAPAPDIVCGPLLSAKHRIEEFCNTKARP